MYLGLYTTLMNLGAFVMPMLGVSLANRFGFQPVLIAGGLMCLAGSSLFAWRPLQTPDSLALRQRTELISTAGRIPAEAFNENTDLGRDRRQSRLLP
jgi:cyanate permease